MNSMSPTRRSKNEILERMHNNGVVAVIRAESTELVLDTVSALVTGGLRTIEITFTTPGAAELIREVKSRYDQDEVLVGAGTVLETIEAAAAIEAGAEFLISPSIEIDVINHCLRESIVCIPGAYTPTEIRTAVKAGADVVKVFPASIGGATYIRDLKGPLPGVPLLPSGSVSFETVGAFFDAGSFAVAVGSLLVDKQLMREGRFNEIADKTRRFVDLVATCRKR